MAHDHQRLGIEFNNTAWDLLEKPNRTPAEDQEMIHAAHASHAHWLKAGTAINAQRGEWLIARVYAELGRIEPALHHLRETERLTDGHRDELADFDFAFLEALQARVAALAQNDAEAELHYATAKRLGEALDTEEDRKIFFDQLKAGAWFGFSP
jgi:hypothetical protein